MPLHKSAEGWVRLNARKEARLGVRTARMDGRIHAIHNREIIEASSPDSGEMPESVRIRHTERMMLPEIDPRHPSRRRVHLFG
jgi:hypothetical protein